MFQSCNTKLYEYKNFSQILWSGICPSQLYSDLDLPCKPGPVFIKHLKSNVYVTLNAIGSFRCNL